MSFVTSLKCRECGKTYEKTAVHVCEMCFGPLEVAYDYAAIARALTREVIARRPTNMWRYAELLPLDQNRSTRVLDISASHGAWGIAFARKNPKTQLVALDWAPVLQVATKNAQAAGIADRFSTIAGSAFEVDLGKDYDVVLIPNFLHHFNRADCIRFLKRCHTALRPGGFVAIVEFIPNPDRITPPQAAGFSLVMLATTPEGDAYTNEEYTAMLAEAGFEKPVAHMLPASVNQVLIAVKK